ncbi:MAG: hypothetical protein U9R34_05780 [Nanoarchaeota archaeon]|nr:hypothetical protein [Nanoarchaeota archaeon]
MSKKIIDLLKPDSKIVAENLKTILDKEQEYAEFLFAIENCVLDEFLNNRSIKDKEIIHYLKHFLDNLDKDEDYFESHFEANLYENLIEILNERKITKHELVLCIKYLLWSIDNRSWLDDSQAYVKWLTHSADVMSQSEKKAYEEKVRTLCKGQGIPDNRIEAMLKNDFRDIEMEDKENTDIESEFFALDDNKKYDFVIDNFNDAPFLFEVYYSELMESKNYDLAEKLCKQMSEIIPELPQNDILLGVVYKEKGNNILAKHHLEKGLIILDETPDDIISTDEKKAIVEEVKLLLKEVSE